jgi:hypothetical protein
VTEELSGPGEYDVILRFLDGNSGVTTRSAAFLAGKDEKTARLLDEDRWTFRIGRWDRYVDYWLSFSKEAANGMAKGDRLFLKVELTGPDLSLSPDRRTTHGRVSVRKSLRK